MKFSELIEQLNNNFQNSDVYSVENRNMLNHDTASEYFLDKSQAVAQAEFLWNQLDEQARADYEISVHLGALEYQTILEQYRFIVHKKLFKAYKKVHVAEGFVKKFIAERKVHYTEIEGVAEDDATVRAWDDFNAQYTLQTEVAYGMFAAYDYEPTDSSIFNKQI